MTGRFEHVAFTQVHLDNMVALNRTLIAIAIEGSNAHDAFKALQKLPVLFGFFKELTRVFFTKPVETGSVDMPETLPSVSY